MMLATHPDKNRENPKATAAFEAVGKANTVLSNSDDRTEYVRKYVLALASATEEKSWKPSAGSAVADSERDVLRLKQLSDIQKRTAQSFHSKILEMQKQRIVCTAAAQHAPLTCPLTRSLAAPFLAPVPLLWQAAVLAKRKAPDSFKGFGSAKDADGDTKMRATSSAGAAAAAKLNGTPTANANANANANATAPAAAAAAAAADDDDDDDDADRLAAFKAKKRKGAARQL
jgi:curved DNA-binding protein CbpA